MVTIGVTGHRQLNEVEQISSGVDEALHKVKRTFPGESLTIISPLAEGADRLVVWRALEFPDTRLIVALPMEMDDYMTDFRTQESREEFQAMLARTEEVIELPPRISREEAYLAVGRYILDHCQILIAVWDGLPARGQGGTGQIVNEAQQCNKPIAWVFARNQELDASSPITLGKTQGNVTWERFPPKIENSDNK